MTDTLANNKLIAEFMGLDMSELSEWDALPGRLVRFDNDLDFTVIEYDTSWDWLMPVVVKIEALEFAPGLDLDFAYFSFHCFRTHCSVYMKKDNFLDLNDELVTSHSNSTKIEAVYYTVVNFIKWYNEQVKNK